MITQGLLGGQPRHMLGFMQGPWGSAAHGITEGLALEFHAVLLEGC